MEQNGLNLLRRNELLREILALCFCCLLASVVFNTRVYANDQIAIEIRAKLEAGQPPAKLWVGCEVIHANADLLAFYSDRQFVPLWLNERGLNDLGRGLPVQLADSRLQGLNPEDYHLRCINANVNRLNSTLKSQKQMDPKALADLDLLMTDGFMIYASNLSTGKVDPERLYPLWLSEKEKANIIAGLDSLVRTRDLAETIKGFAPAHEQYWRLVDAAQKMEKVVAAGGWPTLPAGESIRPGDRNPQVGLLRRRLQISGELGQTEAVVDADVYDEVLEIAVKKFQLLHGLATDGVVGPNTREALNVSAAQRRQQILLNLERWRWLPHRWDNNYIVVNTAAFSLMAHRPGKTVTMRVIVGKDYQKTPVFSEKMSYIEVNPYWNVPRSITAKELLPEIKKDPGYLAKHNYQIVSSDGIISPWMIDWETVSARNFHWRIRQKPGAKNALGYIKFMFPNRFNVYMHDTPDRHLFKRARRAFSHGCIRVQKPLELALLILQQDDPNWTRERLEQLIQGGKRRILNIHSDWMVHILYWTAWVNDWGQLQFCQDIYDRDPVLWQALNKATGNSKTLVSSNS